MQCVAYAFDLTAHAFHGLLKRRPATAGVRHDNVGLQVAGRVAAGVTRDRLLVRSGQPAQRLGALLPEFAACGDGDRGRLRVSAASREQLVELER